MPAESQLSNENAFRGENETVDDVCVANGRAAASRIGATKFDCRCSSGAGAVRGRQN
jgi:hypothetical protein